MSNNKSITIRPMQPNDVDAYLGLVKELATYENMADQVKATAADITRDFFGDKPHVEAMLAFDGDKAVGYGVFHPIYSTFRGNHGVYIEDVYMNPDYRGGGNGKRMISEICAVAQERGYTFAKWVTLDWNQPTLDFNQRLGAMPEAEWVLHCLPTDKMAELAKNAAPKP